MIRQSNVRSRFARVVPQMLARGISREHVDRMLVDNPRRMLTFA